MGYITGQARGQVILFPESIDDYIEDSNSVRVIDAYGPKNKEAFWRQNF